jgi:hypothetical protein
LRRSCRIGDQCAELHSAWLRLRFHQGIT